MTEALTRLASFFDIKDTSYEYVQPHFFDRTKIRRTNTHSSLSFENEQQRTVAFHSKMNNNDNNHVNNPNAFDDALSDDEPMNDEERAEFEAAIQLQLAAFQPAPQQLPPPPQAKILNKMMHQVQKKDKDGKKK